MRNSTAVRLAAVLAVAVAIGSTWQRSEPAHAADGTVSIASFAFAPGLVAVDEGDSVTWTNNDSVIHSVVFTTGPSSSVLNPGQNFTRSFDSAGTFVYQCGVHPSMSGSVTVAGAQAPTATSTPTAGPPTITPTNTTAPQTATATVTPTPTPTPASGGGEDPTASATPGGDATDTPTAAGSTPTAADQTGTPAPTGTPGNGDEGDDDDDDGGSNTGLAVGVVIAVLAGVVIAAVGIAMRRRGA